MNPWFMAYSNLTGMLDVAKPGAIIVTGRGNRYHPDFQEARKRGAKVYTYWNVANAPYNLSNLEDAAQYLIAGKAPPAWPVKTGAGKDRSQWPGTYLLDLRPGSAWLKHIVPLTKRVWDRGMFDGFFLDTLGARCWSSTKTVDGVVRPGADWGTWSVQEQADWATGCINIAAELAAVLPALCELVHNNIWAGIPKGHPAEALAANGERFCNGVCLENPTGDIPGEFHKNYAGRTFGRLPRRLLVIDRTDADTLLWSKVQGVTHVCSVEQSVGENYARVTPPVVPYTGWGDAPPPPPPPPPTTEEKLATALSRISALEGELATAVELNGRLGDANEQLLDEKERREAKLTAVVEAARTIMETVASP